MGSDCARGAHWAFLGRGTLTRAHTRPRRARAPARALTLTPAHTHPRAHSRRRRADVQCTGLHLQRGEGWSTGRMVAARGSGPGHRCPDSLLGEGINPPLKKRPEREPYLFTLKRNLFLKSHVQISRCRGLLDSTALPNIRLVNGSTASTLYLPDTPNPKIEIRDSKANIYVPLRAPQRLQSPERGGRWPGIEGFPCLQSRINNPSRGF